MQEVLLFKQKAIFSKTSFQDIRVDHDHDVVE